MGEKNEPEDIDEDGAEEEDGVGSAQTLTAALDGHQSEQRNG